MVLGWYDNRDLFHKIGYLIASGHTLKDLVKLSEGKAKSDFEAALGEWIRTDLMLSAADVGELSYESAKSVKVLLLMNVETVRRMQHSSERYSFGGHASGSWSLEHIHAQNAETLNRAEQWTEWLCLHRNALEGLSDVEPAQRAALVERIDRAVADPSEETFRPLARIVHEPV